MKKKLISVILVIAFVFGVVTPASYAIANDKQIYVSATSDETIKIEKQEETIEPDYNGELEITGGEFNIKRDYSQYCIVKVKNLTGKTLEYYLTVYNAYDDLYLNFVRSGSVDIPLIIDAGETQEVRLDIFAQNAKLSKYELPIYAHVIGSYKEKDSKSTVIINVPKTSANFSMTLTAENPNSLSKSFTLQNLGEYLTDVEVFAEGDLSDYISFSPVISNYPMDKNEKIDFKATPDLTKMKDNDIKELRGKIVVASGTASQKFDVVFNTNGQEITSMTIGELLAIQNGNANTVSSNGITIGTFTVNTSTSQCTNAGKVTTKFYLPGITVKKKSVQTNAVSTDKVGLFVTSRMYGGSYVNKAETNYDYILNGEKVARSSNTGLTELSIAELPADKLKFGEMNTLIRDYDTNPGSHSVTSDTQIIVTLPSDAIISYVGSPTGLEDIRSLPDLAVYSENIFTESDKVYIGEKTKISMNIYNRGSEDCNYNITVSDGKDIIYTENNKSIDAFGNKKISFDWTPENETSNISVTLTNTDPNAIEKNDKNNIASKSIIVTERKEPTISYISNTVEKYRTPVSIYADIKDTSEITSVEFFVDNTKLDGTLKTSNIVGGFRYTVESNELYSIGEHDIKVIVSYKESKDSIKSVEKTATLRITEKDWIVPTVSLEVPEYSAYNTELIAYAFLNNEEDVVGVKFVVDNAIKFIGTKESDSTYRCKLNSLDVGEHNITAIVTYEINKDGDTAEVVSKEEKVTILSEKDSFFKCKIPMELIYDLDVKVYYQFDSYSEYDYLDYSIEEGKKHATIIIPYTEKMVKNKDVATIFFVSDNAVLCTSINESGITVEKSDCKIFSIKGESKVNNITVRAINDMEIYLYSYTSSKEFYFTPGRYEVDLELKLFNDYYDKTYSLDLTTDNKSVDLLAESPKVNYLFKDNTSTEIKNTYLQCYIDGYWQNIYGINYKNSDSDNYSIAVINDYYANKFKEANKFKLLVVTNNAIYEILIDDITKMGILDKAVLNKITVTPEDRETMTITGVVVSYDNKSARFEGNEFYAPNGDYKLDVTCKYANGKTIVKHVNINSLSDNQTIIIDSDFVKVAFKWDNAFDYTGMVYTYGENKGTYSSQEIINGNYIVSEKDKYSISTYLMRNESTIAIASYIDCTNNDGTINIGNEFIGKLSLPYLEDVVDGNSYISLTVYDLKDNNGNKLSSYETYNYDDRLTGYVIYTNVLTNEKIKVDISMSSLYEYDDIYARVPNVSGEYSVSIELSTSGKIIETDLIVPNVNVYYDKGFLYKCGQLPEISLGSESVPGNVYWETTDLKMGTSEYKWIFVPEDKNTYKSVSGIAELTVVDGHNWSDWVSDGNSKFFVDGTKTHKCIACGQTETVLDEGSAGYHEYLRGGNKSWITATVITAIAVTITWFVVHFHFWWVIGL